MCDVHLCVSGPTSHTSTLVSCLIRLWRRQICASRWIINYISCTLFLLNVTDRQIMHIPDLTLINECLVGCVVCPSFLSRKEMRFWWIMHLLLMLVFLPTNNSATCLPYSNGRRKVVVHVHQPFKLSKLWYMHLSLWPKNVFMFIPKDYYLFWDSACM